MDDTNAEAIPQIMGCLVGFNILTIDMQGRAATLDGLGRSWRAVLVELSPLPSWNMARGPRMPLWKPRLDEWNTCGVRSISRYRPTEKHPSRQAELHRHAFERDSRVVRHLGWPSVDIHL